MSCKYCEEERNMFSGSVSFMGCSIDRIEIERVCLVPDKEDEHARSQARIFAGVDHCEAWTKPINYCPMCGAKLTGGDNYDH